MTLNNDVVDNKRALLKWALQSASRELLPDWRVADCLRKLVPGRRAVEIWHSLRWQRAHYKALHVCSSVWVCPVCASKISERRRADLAAGIEAHGELRAVLVTFTVQHSREDTLGVLLGDLLASYRDLKRHRPWVSFALLTGLVGSVRSLEFTYGVHGWHPHLHSLYFFDRRSSFDPGAVTEFFKSSWLGALEKNGLAASYTFGVDVRAADADVAGYVAKFGREPVRPSWSLEAELTKSGVKVSRGEGGRSPLQLLADHLGGDKAAGHLWVEYAAATKGKHQLQWTRGLRALLGLGVEQTDEQIAAAVEDDAVLLAALGPEVWRVVLANDARGELLQVARSGDVSAVNAFLVSLGAVLDGAEVSAVSAGVGSAGV